MKIDNCKVGADYGCVEYCYPSNRWEIVYTGSNCYGRPTDQMIDAAKQTGATVLAYGGDGVWYGLVERK